MKKITLFVLVYFAIISSLFSQNDNIKEISNSNLNTNFFRYKSKTNSEQLPDELKETSGLFFWQNSFWTNNDSEDKNIYSLQNNGAVIKKIELQQLTNIDWEDISQDDKYIYIGDFGNNNGSRKDLKIYRINKEQLINNNLVFETINYSYSNQTDFSIQSSQITNFDCEAMIVKQDSIFLFTKQWSSNKTAVYSLSKNAGSQTANLKFTYNIKGLVTGATYNETNNSVVLCGYSKYLQPFVCVLSNFENNNFFSGKVEKVKLWLPFRQVEAITIGNDNYYYLTNEYFKKVISTKQKLYKFDLSKYL